MPVEVREDDPDFKRLPKFAQDTLRYERWAQKRWRNVLIQWIINVGAGFAASAASEWAFGNPRMIHLAQSTYGRSALVVSSLLLAYALFLFKKYFQMTYGVVEVVFAATTLWQILARQPGDRGTTLLTLAGALYVTTRGMNNIVDGYAKLRPFREVFAKS
jgi:hypothetical protein